ncbi:MAG: PilZ domain-containing protein [Planctomycetota bacterium]
MRSQDHSIDALRISQAEEQAVLAALERSPRTAGDRDARTSPRYCYQVAGGVVVTVERAEASFIVRPRNLSAGGISFLHGSFLYPGARCALALPTRAGERVALAGRIVRCRCVRGRVHEVGVAFDQPIEVERYVDTQAAPLSTASPDEMANAGYLRERVMDLARDLQQLAAENAARHLLERKVAQLTAVFSSSP